MNKEREKENNSVSKPRINHMYASVLLRCSLCAIVCLAVSSNAYALSCSTDIANTIGDNTGTISHTNDTFTVDYGDKGLLTGVGQCSDSSDEIVDDLSGTVGNNCYCKLENYIPNGGTIQTLSGKYVFIYGFPNLPNNVACTSNCAERCAGMLATTDWPDFRDAMLCQSLESPTSVVCPPEFPSYDADATAETDCYRECDIANNGLTFTSIAHATEFKGRDYYNTTTSDTCVPTECEPGWRLNGTTCESICEDGWHINDLGTSCEANIITINWSDTEPDDITANDAGTVEYGGDVRTPVKAQIKKGKAFNGWKFSSTSGSGN